MSLDPSDRLEHILDETIFLIQVRTIKVLLEDLTDIDKKIAQTIVDEYPEDFRDTTTAKIERILGHSDRCYFPSAIAFRNIN